MIALSVAWFTTSLSVLGLLMVALPDTTVAPVGLALALLACSRTKAAEADKRRERLACLFAEVGSKL
jgi:hypothetical protein